MPNEVNIGREAEHHRWTQFEWRIPVVDDAGANVDLTGSDLRCVVSRQHGQAPFIERESGGGGITLDGDDNEIAVIKWGGTNVSDLHATYDGWVEGVYAWRLIDGTSQSVYAYGLAYLHPGVEPEEEA